MVPEYLLSFRTKSGFGRVLTFAIGGTATLNVPPFGRSEPPVPAMETDASPETIDEGRILYALHWFACHGVNAVAGPLPDLRYATLDVHEQFLSIVLGGARQELGMPSFGDLLTAEEAESIRAYVLSRAAESAASPQ